MIAGNAAYYSRNFCNETHHQNHRPRGVELMEFNGRMAKAFGEYVLSNLLLILLCLAVALILFSNLTERFATPIAPEKLAKLSRWILPLVGLMIIAQLIDYLV